MWLGSLIALMATALLVALLAVALTVLHTVYWLVSPPLSAQAQGYEALARALPTSTDNAYRVEGLFAPVALDPMQYGRCFQPLLRLSKDQDAEKQAGLERCRQGQAALSLPPALEQAKVSPGWTEREWLTLAQAAPHQTLLARSKEISNAGPRIFGYHYLDQSPPLSPLRALNLWQSAQALALWQQGRTAEAVSAFESAVEDNLQSADDTVIEAMTSVRGLSQNLLALQLALAQSSSIDEDNARRLRQVLDAVDSMPARGVKAMDAEWATMASGFDFEAMRRQWGSPGVLGWVKAVPYRLAHREDTLNRRAVQFEEARQRMHRSAQGTSTNPPPVPPENPNPCPSLGDAGYFCYAVLPNPTGRYLLASAGNIASAYERYGVRIADVRNLAAATRLTLEARRQQLSGDALAAFVAAAPRDMRDVFTGQPFAYHPATHTLDVTLRHKSTVLGEPGTYALRL